MPLFSKHNDVGFGVGDRVRVIQRITDGEKSRQAIFEGIVISIKAGENPSFLVRRIGEQNVGIERIFPLPLPSIEKIEVLKKGTSGVKHAKLYYFRGKNPHEIEKIYARTSHRNGGIQRQPKKKTSGK
jgi:large subunit ribosomal protein L19